MTGPRHLQVDAPYFLLALLASIAGLNACSGAESGGGNIGAGGASSNSGATATGGANATGGTNASGGGITAVGGTASTGGNSAVGGTFGAGGNEPSGGAAATGGSKTTGGAGTGGAQSTGGINPTGGSKATGGVNATGGSKATGGVNATGGSKATGGVNATGGSKATGGVNATGGSKATGGVNATGGSKATGGTSSAGGTSCPYTGHITYTLAKSANPTATEQTAYGLITTAMDKAITYYNCYTNITKAENVQYNTSVSTADGNINGSIRFGADTSYMDYRTAMHEISHTVGIGQASNWSSFIANGLFTGTNANAQLTAINATLATPLYPEVHADTQHFWPYGINYVSEVTSEAVLIFHCEMVMAIRKDLGLQ